MLAHICRFSFPYFRAINTGFIFALRLCARSCVCVWLFTVHRLYCMVFWPLGTRENTYTLPYPRSLPLGYIDIWRRSIYSVLTYFIMFYVCTLCFIIHVLRIEKSNNSLYIGLFSKSILQMKGMAYTIFLSKGNLVILSYSRDIANWIGPLRNGKRVLDWYKKLEFWRILTSMHF